MGSSWALSAPSMVRSGILGAHSSDLITCCSVGCKFPFPSCQQQFFFFRGLVKYFLLGPEGPGRARAAVWGQREDHPAGVRVPPAVGEGAARARVPDRACRRACFPRSSRSRPPSSSSCSSRRRRRRSCWRPPCSSTRPASSTAPPGPPSPPPPPRP